MKNEAFTQALLAWYAKGHRDLPWRRTKEAYRIWVSEIMLQQTRAETVIAYYERFLALFPTVQALAQADEQAVLKAWEGLGYYSRARNLQKAARVLCGEHGGALPHTAEELRKLPGIGAYTSAAIASIAHDEPIAAVDGNVQRVIARYCGVRADIKETAVDREIRALAQEFVPQKRAGDFSNAMMELGACVCTPKKPDCANCPVRDGCDAYHVGDAPALPIKSKAKKQRIEKRGIALIFCEKRVLVQKRTEDLLHGLWVFPDVLAAQEPLPMAQALAGAGIEVIYDELLGKAKHVFSHIIWEMTIQAFVAECRTPWEGGAWVTRKELEALPMPTAVKVARKAAITKLKAMEEEQ